MRDQTAHESSFYGEDWHEIHNGYFSDREVAAPLVGELAEAIKGLSPSVVADLGGGTGFLLQEVLSNRENAACAFLNVDVSEEQLSATSHPEIEVRARAVQELRRGDLIDGEGMLLLCMRSILHYFGRDGQARILAHLRSLLREGEMLIHQTACFEREEEGLPLNLLYEMMGTSKWYPTVEELSGALGQAGLEVEAILDAPTLPLRSIELQERYRISDFDITRITDEIKRICGTTRTFAISDDGFTAYLDYKIFRCRAS